MGLFSKIINNSLVEQENNDVSSYNSSDFFMEVEDIFTVIGRGTVVTGRVSSGSVKVGDIIKINNTISVSVVGIEMFRKKLDEAIEGDNVGLLIEGIDRKDIKKKDILSK